MNVDFRGLGTRNSSVRPWFAVGLLLAVAGTLISIGSHSRNALAQIRTAAVPSNRAITNPTITGANNLSSNPQILEKLAALPMIFEPNQGQTAAQVKFLAQGAGYGLFLDSTGATISLRDRSSKTSLPDVMRVKLVGANAAAKISGDDRLPGATNYFLGNDSSKWRRNIAHFARVKYQDVYPGTDLVFYGNQGCLEYDFHVAPGADPAKAELQFDGADRIQLSHGNLLLRRHSAELQLLAPRIYQKAGDREDPVKGRFVIRGANRVGFEIGAYDRSRELVIDPILVYATYFGGTADETLPSIATDGAGNIYLAGSTDSLPTTFPPTPSVTTDPTPFPAGTHVFVAEINPSVSSGAVFESFLGGTGSETNVGLAVDGSGNVYIAGTTTSADYPTTINGYQTVPYSGSTGSSHAYVSVLSFSSATASTNLNYSSYLSGNGTEIASGMAIDSKGDMFVTGTTTSNLQGNSSVEFPASAPPEAEPFQTTPRAPLQFFVTEVNTTSFGSASIPYSTYFGGGTPSNGVAVGGGITVDAAGSIYFTGTTSFVYTGANSINDFPIVNAYQPCLDQTPPTIIVTPPVCNGTGSTTATDAFLAKLNPNATGTSQLIWSTYFGGAATDSGAAIAIDSGAANVYITGTTNSSSFTFPTNSGAFQPCLNNIFTGTLTNSPCGSQTGNPPPSDAYVARFNNPSSGTMTLGYFSYIGGSGAEQGLALTIDTTNDALVTGSTQSSNMGYPTTPTSGNFPVTAGAIQSHLNGPQNAFFARINTAAIAGTNQVGSFLTYYGGNGTDRGTSIAIDNNLNAYFAGDTTSTNLQVASWLQGSNAGGSDAFAVKLGTAASISVTGVLSLSSGQQYVSAGSPATFNYTVTNNGPDPATNLTFLDDIRTLTTGIPVTFISASSSPGTCSQSASSSSAVVCTIPQLQSGSTATVKIVLTPTAGGNFNGGAVTVTGSNTIGTGASAQVAAQASDFSISISPSAQQVSAGQPATYQILLTPTFPYSSTISLSVNNLSGIAGTGSTFSPSSVTLNGPVSSTLVISTTPRQSTTASLRMRGAFYALWLVLPGMLLLGVGTGGRRKRKLLGIVLFCALFALLTLQPACSGGTTTTPPVGTPAGNYQLTVTGTSGAVSHSQTFSLNVL